MKLPNFIKQSVAGRTTFLVLCIISIITLMGGYFQIRHMRSVAADDAYRQANRSMDNAIKVINNRITNVETAVNTAAAYADMMAPHEMMGVTLLQRLIEANEDIAAVTLMYRADFFKEHGRYYAPTISRNPVSGALEEDEIGGPEHDFCYLETDSNWIYTNKLDEGYWCLPYIDSMSTKRAMVTYSVPLHDTEGQTYAILCADIDLRWVRNIVEAAKPYDDSKVVVIGRDSQYVCHPDLKWVQSVNVIQQAHNTKNSGVINMTERILKWQRGVDTVESQQLFGSDNNNRDSGPTYVFYAPIPRVQWAICFTISEAKVMQQPNQLRVHLAILLVVLLVIISWVLRAIIHSQLQPLKVLASSTAEVAKGDFTTQLPTIKTHDEIRELRDSFEDMQTSLSEYIIQLKDTTASKAAIESELHVATDIQMSMLPKQFLPIEGHEDVPVFGQLTPAKAVGGDLFDFFVRGEKLFFCIGDVSGKGVPAALVMAVTQALFRSISANESSPANIVGQLNNSLARHNDSNMFVTLFVGILDLNNGHLLYSNAGHDAPLLIGQGIGWLPCDSNLPAGIMADWAFTQQEADIYLGTTIFLYTDGLTEAENISHQQFGEDRIMKVAETYPATPQQLIEAMTQGVHEFVRHAEQSDDLTMLAIKYK